MTGNFQNITLKGFIIKCHISILGEEEEEGLFKRRDKCPQKLSYFNSKKVSSYLIISLYNLKWASFQSPQLWIWFWQSCNVCVEGVKEESILIRYQKKEKEDYLVHTEMLMIVYVCVCLSHSCAAADISPDIDTDATAAAMVTHHYTAQGRSFSPAHYYQ